jgi:hypothetical protein
MVARFQLVIDCHQPAVLVSEYFLLTVKAQELCSVGVKVAINLLPVLPRYSFLFFLGECYFHARYRNLQGDDVDLSEVTTEDSFLHCM